MIQMRPRFDRPAPVPIKKCTICGDQLYRGAVGDKCQWHPKPTPQCACGTPIQRDNASGLCVTCYRASKGFRNGIGKQREAEQITRIQELAKAQPVGISMQVIGYVTKIFNLTPEDIAGPRRFRLLIEARCVVVVILRQRQFSYPQIGRVMGGRDHSTIISLCKNFESRARERPEMKRAVVQINEALAEVDAKREAARVALAEGMGA